MKSTLKNLFDAANSTLINFDALAGWGVANVIEPSPVLENISGNGLDINLLHILNMPDAHGFQSASTVENTAPAEPDSALANAEAAAGNESPALTAAPADVVDAGHGGARLAFAGAGSTMYLLDKAIDSAGDTFESDLSKVFVAQPLIDGMDGNLTDVSIEMPEILVCEGHGAPETLEFNGEPEAVFTKESQYTEFNAVEIDAPVDMVLTEYAPVEDVSKSDETVDASGGELAIEMCEPSIRIGMLMMVDPFVWTDSATFEFNFSDVLLFKPAIDGVETNGADTLLSELMTFDGDLMSETLTFKGEPEVIFAEDFVETESGAVEITLTGVAEGYLA